MLRPASVQMTWATKDVIHAGADLMLGRKTCTGFNQMPNAKNVENIKGVSPNCDTQQSTTRRWSLQLCKLVQLLILVDHPNWSILPLLVPMPASNQQVQLIGLPILTNFDTTPLVPFQGCHIFGKSNTTRVRDSVKLACQVLSCLGGEGTRSSSRADTIKRLK